jgi:hypothetical protein
MDEGDRGEYIGRMVQINHWGSYVYAARELGALQRNGQLDLKVRSGEHIAAIALTAQLYPELPTISDVDGGVDLGFGAPLHTAAEFKSIRSGWRRHEASMALGDVHETRIVSWAEAVTEIESAAGEAESQLAHKLGLRTVGAGPKRYAIILAFMLDLLAIELLDAGALPSELPELRRIDADQVWVILFPGTVQVWDTTTRRWTTLFAAAREGDDVSEPVDFHELEKVFLEAAGHSTSDSPFYDVVESIASRPD